MCFPCGRLPLRPNVLSLVEAAPAAEYVSPWEAAPAAEGVHGHSSVFVRNLFEFHESHQAAAAGVEHRKRAAHSLYRALHNGQA